MDSDLELNFARAATGSMSVRGPQEAAATRTADTSGSAKGSDSVWMPAWTLGWAFAWATP